MGITLSAYQNAKIVSNKDTMAKGAIILLMGIPADFMATTSKRSPILPKVISDANRIANGSAMLISEPAA